MDRRKAPEGIEGRLQGKKEGYRDRRKATGLVGRPYWDRRTATGLKGRLQG